MQTFLVILLFAAMLAVLVALIRGLVIFLKNAGAEARGEGPSTSALKSNQAMQQRVIFQGVAIVILVLLMLVAGKH
ncbi:MAG: hypothetical protein JWN66_2257 [Sphingomonas bacterium]|jgi:hypothetical protein|uniref:twin transmembrane helix small protein n=1 Tax=Sphingomonas bacterium TaxID=1895847 RepID=UPI002635F1AB|nr:twin transmembrane helix small protein [Sphingomonas bacterium]MDB5705141.1 hypothetical protein [Sphingomonas bacterium]